MIEYIITGLIGACVVLLGILTYQGHVSLDELRRRRKLQDQAKVQAKAITVSEAVRPKKGRSR